MKDSRDCAARSKERASLSVSLNVLWICLACAGFLDVLGAFEGLGFNPSFQLEAQPIFFVAMAATITLVVARAKLGPLLAGIIFWIPIVVLLLQLILVGDIIPFGGDLVGIAELVVAMVGVVAAHNVYHKLRGGWIQPVFSLRKRSDVEESAGARQKA